jgi:ElaB/YqjD/DUF883 family membrane-anchored ribosome-binding protein
VLSRHGTNEDFTMADETSTTTTNTGDIAQAADTSAQMQFDDDVAASGNAGAAGTAGAGSQGGEGDDQPTTAAQLVKAGASNLGGQATDRLRAFADDGKTRATDALDDVAKMIEDAAATLDDKVGQQFGGYARQAAGAVTDFSDGLRNKDIDALLEDARELVRQSPGIALGTAAALGFLVARVLRSSIDAGRSA